MAGRVPGGDVNLGRRMGAAWPELSAMPTLTHANVVVVIEVDRSRGSSQTTSPPSVTVLDAARVSAVGLIGKGR